MSIEYFVEGSVKIHSEGEITIKSKENIVNNAGVSVEQKGTEAGVTYSKAQEINHNDTPVNTIEVSLNLFFDGTANNKSNTEARLANSKDYQEHSNKKDDSYTNDYSNVAKGFDAIDPSAENQEAEYIEGIGTEDLKGDTLFPGQAIGTGETGIKGKVTKGCIKGAAKLGKYKQRKIDILRVNVYGFSRGAAAARHFVHMASNPPEISYSQGSKVLQVFAPYDLPNSTLIINDEDGTKLPFILQYGYFGAQLVKKELSIKKIVFNFVGLYDTVASYGVVHKNDTEDLGLNSISKAYFVLQLTADDEYRNNFRLTNINSTNLHGLQFTLPGVHSDIGGGYVEKKEETVILYREEGSGEQCERFRKILIDEGWYKDNVEEVWIERLSPHREAADARFLLMGKRSPHNGYCKVPLNQMFHYSKQFGVKYKEIFIEKNHKIEGEPLTTIYNQLLVYMNACNQKRNDYIEGKISGNYIQDIKKMSYLDFIKEEDLKKLRNGYLHWSVDYGGFVNGQNVSGVLPASKRKRTIQDG